MTGRNRTLVVGLVFFGFMNIGVGVHRCLLLRLILFQMFFFFVLDQQELQWSTLASLANACKLVGTTLFFKVRIFANVCKLVGTILFSKLALVQSLVFASTFDCVVLCVCLLDQFELQWRTCFFPWANVGKLVGTTCLSKLPSLQSYVFASTVDCCF